MSENNEQITFINKIIRHLEHDRKEALDKVKMIQEHIKHYNIIKKKIR